MRKGVRKNISRQKTALSKGWLDVYVLWQRNHFSQSVTVTKQQIMFTTEHTIIAKGALM